MRATRNLWLSVAFVAALILGSIATFVGGIRPVLGLDLEGGVSVILAAPAGTSQDVMNQALENIRNRIDAFGVGEPLLFVSGNHIEVQLPGLARGTIQQRAKDQYCLIGTAGQDFGCFPAETAAQTELSGVKVNPLVESVCLMGLGDNPPCYGDQASADTAVKSLSVQPQSQATPSPSLGSPGPSPSTAPSAYCIAGTALGQPICTYAKKADAQAALKSVGTQATEKFCLQDASGATVGGDAGCFQTDKEAQAALSAVKVTHETQQYCVISSAGQDLGCFLTRSDAQGKLQQTGQERLLQVIGTTARLEQREVLGDLTSGAPTFASTPVTCQTPTAQASAGCTFQALKDKNVVFMGQNGHKYQLGPVLVTGDMIKKATATYSTGSATSIGAGWQIDFTLTSTGSKTFADVTTRLVGKQLAIVVDNQVISAPVVKSAITNGSGVITGSFTAQRAKDLATQLNSGALPVNLTQLQVTTVSPTLGQESLHQGLVAAIAGLLALALYLLFYYRLLGVVAWMGMSIWALLAFTLVSVSGRFFGYTLTLAGVAGLVISLGVTADSYIVFFERLKDEVRHGKTPRSAVQPAFKRAYKTIVAADIVTALAAVILYFTAISSVRGFALTLGVATGLDLFVVYFFKRPTVFLIARNERLVNLHGFGLTSGVAAEPLPGEAVPVGGASR